MDFGTVPCIMVASPQVYTLKAEVGKAPQKIRVETRYDWTSERQAINNKYPDFANWVADPTVNWY